MYNDFEYVMAEASAKMAAIDATKPRPVPRWGRLTADAVNDTKPTKETLAFGDAIEGESQNAENSPGETSMNPGSIERAVNLETEREVV